MKGFGFSSFGAHFEPGLGGVGGVHKPGLTIVGWSNSIHTLRWSIFFTIKKIWIHGYPLGRGQWVDQKAKVYADEGKTCWWRGQGSQLSQPTVLSKNQIVLISSSHWFWTKPRTRIYWSIWFPFRILRMSCTTTPPVIQAAPMVKLFLVTLGRRWMMPFLPILPQLSLLLLSKMSFQKKCHSCLCLRLRRRHRWHRQFQVRPQEIMKALGLVVECWLFFKFQSQRTMSFFETTPINIYNDFFDPLMNFPILNAIQALWLIFRKSPLSFLSMWSFVKRCWWKQ